MDMKNISEEYKAILTVIEASFEAMIEVLNLTPEQTKEFYELMDDKIFQKTNHPELIRK